MIVLWILLALIAIVVILLHFSVTAYIKVNGDGFDLKVKYLCFTLYPRQEKPEKQANKNTKSVEHLAQDNKDGDFADNDSDIATEQQLREFKADPQPGYESRAESPERLQPNNSKVGSEKDSTEDKKHKAEKQPEGKAQKSQEGLFSKLKSKYELAKPYIPMGWKYFKKLCKTIRFTDVRISITVGREDAHEAAIFYGALQGVLFNFPAVFATIFTVKIKKADVNCIFTKNTISGEGEAAIRIRPSAVIALAVCVGVNFLIVYFRQRKKQKQSKVDVSGEKAAASV